MTQELSSGWMMSGQLSSALTDLMSLRSVHCVFLYGSLSLAQRWHHGAIAVMIVEMRVSVYGTPRIVLPLRVVLVPVSSGIPVYFLVALKRIWEQKLSSGFMWSLRLPEQHRFSTRPIVSPIIYVCYLQHWIRFYVFRTETSLALPCRVHRHLLISAIMVC